MKLADVIASLSPGDRIILGNEYIVCIDESGRKILRSLGVIIKSGGSNSMYIEDSSPGVISNPPAGHFRVINLYIDSGTGKLVVQYEDTPVT